MKPRIWFENGIWCACYRGQKGWGTSPAIAYRHLFLGGYDWRDHHA